MRLGLSEAISLVSVLPAQRSNNEGHRKIGDKALDLLMEYKELAADETEKAFNRAMIFSVLSTVRAFSIERDRIAGVWTTINNVKKMREGWLEAIRGLGPLRQDSYWSKAVALIIAAGLTFKPELSEISFARAAVVFLFVLVGLQLLSVFLEIIVSVGLERKLPIQKEEKWKNESMAEYRRLLGKFTEEALSHYRTYYPQEEVLYGFRITSEEERQVCKKYLMDLHLYFEEKT